MAKFASGVLGALGATLTVPTDLQRVYTGQGGAGACVGFDLAGTFVATVSWQATIDDANWFPVAAHQTGFSGLPGPISLSTSVPGRFTVNAHGYSQVRVIVTSYTSGSVTAVAALTASQTELLLLREQMITNDLLAQILGVPQIDVQSEYRNDPGYGT